MSTDRSQPLHPTSGPVDGVTWGEYFTAMRSDRAEESDIEEGGAVLEVVEPPRAIDFKASTGTAAAMAKRLDKQGWSVEVRRSSALVSATVFLHDSPEGTPPEKAHQRGDERYPEFVQELTVLVATKAGDDGTVGLALEASWWAKGGFAGARTYDPFLGLEIRRGFTKGRKRNDIEIEEGIAAPLGFREWLDIVAPTPQTKKKAAEKAEQVKGEWIG